MIPHWKKVNERSYIFGGQRAPTDVSPACNPFELAARPLISNRMASSKGEASRQASHAEGGTVGERTKAARTQCPDANTRMNARRGKRSLFVSLGELGLLPAPATVSLLLSRAEAR